MFVGVLVSFDGHRRRRGIENRDGSRLAGRKDRHEIVRVLRGSAEERHHALGGSRARRRARRCRCCRAMGAASPRFSRSRVRTRREIKRRDDRPVVGRILARHIQDVRRDEAELRLGLRSDEQAAVSAARGLRPRDRHRGGVERVRNEVAVDASHVEVRRARIPRGLVRRRWRRVRPSWCTGPRVAVGDAQQAAAERRIREGGAGRTDRGKWRLAVNVAIGRRLIGRRRRLRVNRDRAQPRSRRRECGGKTGVADSQSRQSLPARRADGYRSSTASTGSTDKG